MILNLTLTVTHAPGTKSEKITDVDIVVDQIIEPGPTTTIRYVLESRDEAGKALGRAVAGGLVVRHVLDVNEEPDD